MDRIATPLDHNPAPLRLKSLGDAVLLRPDGSDAIRPSKPLALLTYLHCAPGRTASRDHLCSLLWSDSSPRHAMGSLRTAIHRLNTLLGLPAAEGSATTVSLRIPLAADRDEFLAALDQGDFATAVSLYDGPFFPEYGDPGTALFEQWADGERARLRSLFVRAAEALIRESLDAAHFRDAVRLARHLRTLAPNDETGWRLLLESLLLARDDLGARAEAESFKAWLEHEGLEPEPATRRLIDRIREGGAAEPDAPDRGGLVAELIGRERPFAAALDAWEDVRGGRSRHLHLSAPAGIGKTRFLNDLANRLAAGGARVVLVRTNVGERTLDYALAADLARGLASLPGAKGLPARTAGILIALQPALATTFAAAEPVTSDDPLLPRAQAITELIATVADEAPVAVIIDDVHWLDPASRHILRSAAARLDRGHVLLVTAGRPPETALPAGVPVSTIALDPLSPAQVEAFLGSLAELPAEPWVEYLTTTLHRVTGGSPLLLLETLELTRDRGDLLLIDGTWSCADPAALIARLGVADATAERLRGLDEESGRLAQFLAVAGTPLGADDLAALTARPLEPVETALVALERRGLAALAGQRWSPAHDEIADTVLGMMTAAQVQALHRALGRHWATEPARAPDAIPRAVRHLAAAAADAELPSLFRRWMATDGGADRPTRAQVTALLGEWATPERIGLLESAAAVPDRGTGWRRVSAAALVLVAAAGVTLWNRLGADRPPPDEELLLVAPDGGQTSLFSLPIDAAAWPRGDSLRIQDGRRAGAWASDHTVDRPAMSPDGTRIVFTRIVNDSGVIDLFLRARDGTTRRFTSAAGDDLDPNWSPDGRFIAFRSSRWSPPTDDVPHLAILDPATGAVRQITSGPATDILPWWSPDGTRIAFLRKGPGDRVAVCWTTIDGRTTDCLPVQPATTLVIAGWFDDDHLAVLPATETAGGRLSTLRLSTRNIDIVDTAAVAAAVVSPDGRWVMARSFTGGGEVIYPVADPTRRRWLVRPAGPEAFWSAGGHRLTPDWALAGSVNTTVGVSHHLWVVGRADTARRPTPSVLRWWSSDSSAALVDPTSGIVTPLRPGAVWVGADAGGWWRDSVRLAIEPSISKGIFHESWTDPSLPAWRSFGDPKPRTMVGPKGVAAFHNNGDRTFESGVVSREAFPALRGLGFETVISVPVTRPKWQQLRVSFASNIRTYENGLIAGGCSYSLPAGEGPKSMGEMITSGGGGGATLAGNAGLRDGSWHRLRVQLFPDGTCGVALDGRALWRSPQSIDPAASYQVALYGHSVGTNVLVGPVELWQGVRGGIRWDQAPPPGRSPTRLPSRASR